MPAILFFTSFNTRSINIESSIYEFNKRGYKTILYTTCETGEIHNTLINNNILAIGNKSKWKLFNILLNAYLLHKICKKYNVAIVHAHLQIPSIIAVITNLFTSWKLITVRHHSDIVFINNRFKERIIDSIINKLSPCIVAISDAVAQQLFKEGVRSKKIHRINNGYDFTIYNTLKSDKSIRQTYNCKLLLLSIARHVPGKRLIELINAVEKIIQNNIDIKLVLLDDGPLHIALKHVVKTRGLENNIFLPGRVTNISDYILASDVLVLPSVSEASNNAVKEAGYFEKGIIVCNEVGDFNSYLQHLQSAFFIPKYFNSAELENAILYFYNNLPYIKKMGLFAKLRILEVFDIKKVVDKYEDLHNLILIK